MDPAPITSPALLVYCFASIEASIEHDAERSRGGWDRLNTLWAACRAMGTTEPSLSALAPAELPAAPTGRRAFQVVASARRGGGAVRSVFVFAEHEIVGLVTALSADSAGTDGLSEVLGEWLSHVPPEAPGNGVIGEVTLIVGLCPAGTVVPPDVVDQLGPLATRLGTNAIPLAPGHGPAGTRIWEFRSSAEHRRVIALIAPDDRERELDEWLWAVQGRQGLVPFTRYCLNVAKGRYQAGVYRELTPVSELIADTDRAARKVLERLVEQRNQALDTAALVRADAELQGQQLGDAGLLWRITRLQEMAQTVQTARADARRHMPSGALESADGGLFGRTMLSWAGWPTRSGAMWGTWTRSTAGRARSTQPSPPSCSRPWHGAEIGLRCYRRP